MNHSNNAAAGGNSGAPNVGGNKPTGQITISVFAHEDGVCTSILLDISPSNGFERQETNIAACITLLKWAAEGLGILCYDDAMKGISVIAADAFALGVRKREEARG